MKSASLDWSAMSSALRRAQRLEETEAEANAKALMVLERQRRISERLAHSRADPPLQFCAGLSVKATGFEVDGCSPGVASRLS